MTDDEEQPVELVVDRGAREWERIDTAYERGELDDAGWFDAVRAVIEPGYLRRRTLAASPASSATTIGGSRPGGTSCARSTAMARSSMSDARAAT
jgi:hypothetical protein